MEIHTNRMMTLSAKTVDSFSTVPTTPSARKSVVQSLSPGWGLNAETQSKIWIRFDARPTSNAEIRHSAAASKVLFFSEQDSLQGIPILGQGIL